MRMKATGQYGSPSQGQALRQLTDICSSLYSDLHWTKAAPTLQGVMVAVGEGLVTERWQGKFLLKPVRPVPHYATAFLERLGLAISLSLVTSLSLHF